MWLAEVEELPVILKLKFHRPLHLSALTIWNYNASPELSFYGVRKMITLFMKYSLLFKKMLMVFFLNQ